MSSPAVTAPRAYVGLVGTGTRYRRPLDLSRPDLAAAFADGQRDRAAGREPPMVPPEDPGDGRTMLDRAAAYAAGHRSAVEAPAPLAVWLALFSLDVAAADFVNTRRPITHHPANAVVLVGVTFAHGRIEARAKQWRARRLGLDAATAPRPAAPHGLFPRLALELVLRVATGERWPLPEPSTPLYAATQLVREFEARRSWRAAMREAVRSGRGITRH